MIPQRLSSRLMAARPYLLVSGLALLCGWLVMSVPPAGGISPLMPLLFLPLILAILACKFEFVVVLGLVISAAIIEFEVVHNNVRAIGEAEFIARLINATVRGMVINTVTVIGGLYARQLKQNQRALARRLEEADNLLNLSLWINTSNSLEDAVDIILSALAQVHPYYVAAVFLRDESPALLIAYGSNGSAGPLKYSRLSTEAAGVVNREGSYSPVYVGDVERGEAPPLARLVSGVRSFAAIPLALPNHPLVGVLFIGFDRPHALTPENRTLLQDFALRSAFPLQKTLQQERLHGMAYTDAMTGLKNYRAFRTQLDEEVRRATRYKHPLSLLLLDLDRFKQINDRYGHQMGDRLLAHLASVLRASLRDTDLPARYGGEEFVVLCPETGAADAALVAERIRQAVERTPFQDTQDGTIGVTVSIGVATYPVDAEDEANLLRLADMALYEAKRSGRNRVVSAPRFHSAIINTPLDPTSFKQHEAITEENL